MLWRARHNQAHNSNMLIRGWLLGMACSRLAAWTEPWIATQAVPAEDTAEAAQAGKEADGSRAGYVYDLYALSTSAAGSTGPDALAALGAPLVQVSSAV